MTHPLNTSSDWTLTHTVGAKIVSAEITREPSRIHSAELKMLTDDGGTCIANVPMRPGRGLDFLGTVVKVTFSFSRPERIVDKFDTILSNRGALAALEYARKELAKL